MLWVLILKMLTGVFTAMEQVDAFCTPDICGGWRTAGGGVSGGGGGGVTP